MSWVVLLAFGATNLDASRAHHGHHFCSSPWVSFYPLNPCFSDMICPAGHRRRLATSGVSFYLPNSQPFTYPGLAFPQGSGPWVSQVVFQFCTSSAFTRALRAVFFPCCSY